MKNKILILITFMLFFIGINKINAITYYCQDGFNIPISFNEQDNEYNKNCKYPWTKDSYIKGITTIKNVNYIEMKDFEEVYLNDGLENIDIIRLVGDNTIRLIGTNNENQKWILIGNGSLIIKKASVIITESDGSIGNKENTTYDTPEGLLEYAKRFIITNLDISTTNDGYLKIGGDHPTIDVIAYDNLNNLLQDKKKYADPDNMDITAVISDVSFYNDDGDIVDVPVMIQGGPGYFQRTYVIDDNIYKYNLVISTNKYVGDWIKLANLNFEFYSVNKRYDKYNYMYKFKLTNESFNNYQNQNKKYFMILDSELYNEKRIQNTIYLFFDNSIKELISSMDNTKITNESTGIKLESSAYNLDRSTKLIADEIIDEDTKKIIEEAIDDEEKIYKAYDISLLTSDNLNKQPFGSVLISIPLPNNMDKKDIHVYRISDDGTKIEYEFTIEEDYITFETDHFSNYVIVGNVSYLVGDLNKNNKIDLPDIIMLLKKYLGLDGEISDDDIKLGDMDNDGNIGLKDIILLLKQYLRL